MKTLTVTTVLITLAVLFKLVLDRLSADAVGMAVGLMFGLLAGLPTLLLLLATNRRRPVRGGDDCDYDPMYLESRYPYTHPVRQPMIAGAPTYPAHDAPTRAMFPYPEHPSAHVLAEPAERGMTVDEILDAMTDAQYAEFEAWCAEKEG
jgi:hypothetical protein